jgi:hypothetical protein
MSPVLTQLDADLWVLSQPLSFYGLKVGARMTVVRLADRQLFLHSPIRLTDELRAEIDELGQVRHLVAPNLWHHLFINDWIAAYSDAKSFAAPGLPEKRPDVRFTAVLDDTPGDWAPAIEHLLWRGSPQINEVVFLHRPSRTLILTDSAHNLVNSGGFTRFAFTLLGGYGGFRSTLLDRVAVRDRQAARATVDKICAWDFDRVILAHGEVLATGGRAAFEAAYRWLR